MEPPGQPSPAIPSGLLPAPLENTAYPAPTGTDDLQALQRGRHPHLDQLDALRLLPMLGVVAVHVILYTAPATSRWAGALLMVLHVNRELFFFVSAFVLAYSTGATRRGFAVRRFWLRRYPFVVLPYLAWTAIYWALLTAIQQPSSPSLLALGRDLTSGWFQLYYLLVLMQIYLVFPLLAWVVRCTSGWHWALLLGTGALQLGLDWVLQYRPQLIPQWLFGAALWSEEEVTSYLFYVVAGLVVAAHLPSVLAWSRRNARWLVIATVAAVIGAEAAYSWNLRAGYLPAAASAALQPALLPLVLAVLGGLWVAADRLRQSLPPDHAVWRGLRRGSDLSFGVFLAHMVPLIVVLQPGVARLLDHGGLTWEQLTVLRFAIVVVATVVLVTLLRRTPLSVVLTGRRWRAPRHAPA